MTNSSYILADDLSGALDAGAPFRARGWRVTLPLRSELAGHGIAEGELRLITSESRHLDSAAAAECIRAILDRTGDADLVFKKIDSTLRGHIAAELVAVRDRLAPALMVMAPANPAMGRTVREGCLLVHGRPVSETEFSSDPINPVHESHIATLLAQGGVDGVAELSLADVRQGRDRVRQVLRAAIDRGRSMVVCDAEESADLLTLVEAAEAEEPRSLFVGAGALAGAVASILPLRTTSAPAVPDAIDTSHGMVFVCGSKHPVSLRQMEYLAGASPVHLRAAVLRGFVPEALATEVASDLARTNAAAIVFLADGGGGSDVARDLSAAVAVAVAAIESTSHPAAWFATGGDTAWSVCQALGGQWLDLEDELAPGTIAARLIAADSSSRWLVTKPGGFGEQSTIQQVHSWWKHRQGEAASHGP